VSVGMVGFRSFMRRTPEIGGQRASGEAYFKILTASSVTSPSVTS
jgi:hypothetical protein